MVKKGPVLGFIHSTFLPKVDDTNSFPVKETTLVTMKEIHPLVFSLLNKSTRFKPVLCAHWIVPPPFPKLTA